MFKEYLKLLRIPHWVKNLFIFVPLLFSRNATNLAKAGETVLAFFVFSLAASAVYVLNDIVDAEKDREHPKKKFRPIASGKVSKNSAFILFVLILMLVIFFGFNFPPLFGVSLFLYFVINVAYTFGLKRVVLLDLFCIAGGFILRVLAGAFVIDVYISKWLILTTIFISLFLAVMKRRSEILNVENNSLTRRVLADYSFEFINQISAVTSAGVIICYALYTVSERTVSYFHTEHLVYTTLFVIFGIFRYMYLVYEKKFGENTIETLLKDFPSLINILLYVLTVAAIIY
jgi:4-hydroxybenzoate polyprenyltransferase